MAPRYVRVREIWANFKAFQSSKLGYKHVGWVKKERVRGLLEMCDVYTDYGSELLMEIIW